jgi:hypothetical protein
MRLYPSSGNFVFLTVVLLTVLSGLISLSLSSESTLNEHQKRILENSNTTWLMGTGTIFGLLGSCAQATAQLNERSDETKK